MVKLGNCLKCLVIRLLELAFVFLLVVYMPGLPPEGKFTKTHIVPSKPLEGVYSLNNYLDNAEHLFVDKLKGPENFAEYKNELYTGIHGGEIVKLLPNGDVVHVAKIGHACEGYWQEQRCGRPLGMVFDKSGKLYVCDSYYGIWKVNIDNGHKQLLVSPNDEIEGRKPKIFNSLAIASNGDFYWTDSSSDVQICDGAISMLLDGSGRLFYYDAKKNASSVLLDGLWFANGVAISPNEDFVVVSETGRSQIRRYYIKGPKKGTDDIFVDGLPGMPDNLKSLSNEGLLVPLVAARDESHPAITQSLAPHPLIRKFVARILNLVEMPFVFAQRIMPHYAFERAINWIGHFESVQALVPKRVTVLKLDWSGNVVECWHNLDGSLHGISEVHIFHDKLYFGSPYNNYIGRTEYPGKRLVQKVNIKAPEQPPPTPKATQSPKPTTQPPTPKPTEKVTTQAPKKQESTPKPTEAPKPAKKNDDLKKPTVAPATQKPVESEKKAQQKENKVPKNNVDGEKLKAEKKPKQKENMAPKPIVEEIPSDTKAPKEESLKVIKKEGPMEMPHPDTKKQKNAVPKNAQP